MDGKYRGSRTKIRKTILVYAASAVLETHMERRETKYRTLRAPTATFVKDGPPTPSRPSSLDVLYMSEYTFAMATDNMVAKINESTETNSYWSMFSVMRMNRGEPRVSPTPTESIVPSP